MQFEMNHKIGTDYSTVNFNGGLNKVTGEAFKKMFETFEKLGMHFKEDSAEMLFPKHITPKVIQEVIQNTCYVCGGLMKNSTAMVDQQFEFEHDVYGTVTQQVPGYAKQIKVRKCTACGHSHT